MGLDQFVPGQSGWPTASQQGRDRGPGYGRLAWKAIQGRPEGQPGDRLELDKRTVLDISTLYIHTASGNPAERRLQRARGMVDPTVITGGRRRGRPLDPS